MLSWGQAVYPLWWPSQTKNCKQGRFSASCFMFHVRDQHPSEDATRPMTSCLLLLITIRYTLTPQDRTKQVLTCSQATVQIMLYRAGVSAKILKTKTRQDINVTIPRNLYYIFRTKFYLNSELSFMLIFFVTTHFKVFCIPHFYLNKFKNLIYLLQHSFNFIWRNSIIINANDSPSRWWRHKLETACRCYFIIERIYNETMEGELVF